MSWAGTLTEAFASMETDAAFSEAVLTLDDGSRLCFRHRVGERWAKSIGPEGEEADQRLAGDLLQAIGLFRLNAKHLEIFFDDGSTWERSP